MSLAKHLEDAAERLKEANARIDEAQRKPPTPETTRQWLSALTDCCRALADIQTYNNESIHEKLQDLSRRARVDKPPTRGR